MAQRAGVRRCIAKSKNRESTVMTLEENETRKRNRNNVDENELNTTMARRKKSELGKAVADSRVSCDFI